MSSSLHFEGTAITFLERDGDGWLRLAQIAPLIGYKYDRGVNSLYSRHRDKFREKETTFIFTDTVKGQKAVRIFNLRAACRLAILAKNDRAKRFQIWALDFIERENEERDERLAAAESRVREMRSIVLASKPGWNKIARYWAMGYPVERIAALVPMSKAQTQQLCAELVAVGILHPRPESEGDRVAPPAAARQCCMKLEG